VVIDAPDWVNVIALTPDGQLVLVRQFRFGVDTFSLEIPGGMIDRGEDPVAGRRARVARGDGLCGRDRRLLGTVHPNPAIQSNRCHLVLVESAVQSGAVQMGPRRGDRGLDRAGRRRVRVGRDGRITHALVLDALCSSSRSGRR